MTNSRLQLQADVRAGSKACWPPAPEIGW